MLLAGHSAWHSVFVHGRASYRATKRRTHTYPRTRTRTQLHVKTRCSYSSASTHARTQSVGTQHEENINAVSLSPCLPFACSPHDVHRLEHACMCAIRQTLNACWRGGDAVDPHALTRAPSLRHNSAGIDMVLCSMAWIEMLTVQVQRCRVARSIVLHLVRGLFVERAAREVCSAWCPLSVIVLEVCAVSLSPCDGLHPQYAHRRT